MIDRAGTFATDTRVAVPSAAAGELEEAATKNCLRLIGGAAITLTVNLPDTSCSVTGVTSTVDQT